MINRSIFPKNDCENFYPNVLSAAIYPKMKIVHVNLKKCGEVAEVLHDKIKVGISVYLVTYKSFFNIF